MFRIKPAAVWSIPGSEADCEYDIDELALGENYELVEEDQNEQEGEEEGEGEGEGEGEAGKSEG